MSDVVDTLAALEGDVNLHLGRLLVLISAFSSNDSAEGIRGLTKVAKLDFLLRYPVLLERALEAKGKSTSGVNVKDHERLSVESEMVRYRFGPWDHRYREFLNVLVAKNLVSVGLDGRTVTVALTDRGQQVAASIRGDPSFEDYVRRSALLKKHFDVKATSLMNFIYETFPEIISLRSNERIST